MCMTCKFKSETTKDTTQVWVKLKTNCDYFLSYYRLSNETTLQAGLPVV